MCGAKMETAPHVEARGGRIDWGTVGDETPERNVAFQPDIDKQRLALIEGARAYADDGLSIIPVAADGSRTPLMRGFQNRRNAPSFRAIRRHWTAPSVVNVGIVTGRLSRLTVVDVDEPGVDALDDALAEFGKTPAIVSTGKGWHLYYRHNGERCRPNLGRCGVKGDVKGEGGYVLAPPSVHQSGRVYAWHIGSPAVLCNDALPCILDGVLSDPLSVDRRSIPAGCRNNEMFKRMRGHVRRCATVGELVTFGLEVRGLMEQPDGDVFGVDEVKAVADSVWKWWETNPARGQERFGKVTVSETLELWSRNTDAVVLLAYIRAAGHAVGADFALSAKAISKAVGVGVRRIRKARDMLIETGLVVQTHQGGKAGDGDTSKFQWGARSVAVLVDRGEGTKSDPNTDTITRPPSINETPRNTLGGSKSPNVHPMQRAV